MVQFFTNIDVRAFFALNSLSGQSPFFNSIIVFFAEYLAFILPVVFIFLLYRQTSHIREKIWIFCIVFFSAIITKFGVAELIHIFYQRPRPFLTYNIFPLFSENTYSFPSGHASFFFAFSFAIYLYNKKWGFWFLVASVFMTVSRIIAGVHYPSDILGGMVLGILVAYFTFEYFGPLFHYLIP